MVWYGMVWYGMAWHGMAWHGMVWYGRRVLAEPFHVAHLVGIDGIVWHMGAQPSRAGTLASSAYGNTVAAGSR